MPAGNFRIALTFLAAAGWAAVQTVPLWGQIDPLEPAQAPAVQAPAESRALLSEAVRRAVRENPRIRAAEARTEAARHRVPQAGLLPDPEIEVGLKDVPVGDLSLSRDNFTMEMLGGSQRLPGRGKRRAERAAARAEVEIAAAGWEREAVEIAADTADAFFQLAESDTRLAILAEARARFGDASASATELYRVGRAGPSDILQANLETTSLDERIAALRAERRMQAARLNALQGLPADAPVAPLGPLDLETEAATAIDRVREAVERSPRVAGAQAEVRRAEQDLDLALLESRPDWKVSGYYGRRERFEDYVGLSASIPLPWFHRRRLPGLQAEKEAELAGARAGVLAIQNELQGEIEAVAAELLKNRELFQLYTRSILPQAEINYRAAREAYVVGKIDFLALLRAADDLDRYRLAAVARGAGIGRALAALQKASGLPLIAGTPETGDPDVEN